MIYEFNKLHEGARPPLESGAERTPRLGLLGALHIAGVGAHLGSPQQVCVWSEHCCLPAETPEGRDPPTAEARRFQTQVEKERPYTEVRIQPLPSSASSQEFT